MVSSHSVSHLAASVACGLLLSACHLAPAKVWNLEQVHESDGTPKRHGVLHGDLGYVVSQVFRSTNFGGKGFQNELDTEKKIEDPLGTCLENVLELGACRADERVAGLQAATFAWLAVDCTYELSRERCVLELGALAQRLELAQNPPAAVSGETATPELVTQHYDQLVATMRAVLNAPALAGHALADDCDGIRALNLDRLGAIRLLRTTSALLEHDENAAALAPLRALRLDLARRCTALALRAAHDDPHGRVRAAAVEALARAFPLERPELLRWALTDRMEGVELPELPSLAALELLALYGPPPPMAGKSVTDAAHEWRDLVVQILRQEIDDLHASAACRALAKVTGEPATLRPEVWVERWREQGGAVESGVGEAGARGTAP